MYILSYKRVPNISASRTDTDIFVDFSLQDNSNSNTQLLLLYLNYYCPYISTV